MKKIKDIVNDIENIKTSDLRKALSDRGYKVKKIKDNIDYSKIKITDDMLFDSKLIINNLRKKINTQQSEISKLNAEKGKALNLEKELIELIPRLDPYLPLYNKKYGGKKNKTELIPVFQYGDWHIGEYVDKELMAGLGEYNYEIAQKRALRIIDSQIGWIDDHRTRFKIKECHIIDIGDNISGEIHQELLATNEFPVPIQIVKSAYLKAEIFRRIACNIPKVTITWVVPDNHSRRTKKVQYKESGANSYNYLVGFITKTILQNIKNINFKIDLSLQSEIKIFNSIYLAEHGNTLRGHYGIPWYGVDRKVGKESKRRMYFNKKFDKLLIQHWHTPVNLPYMNIGGSLSGTNEVDHANTRFGKPCQCAFMEHPTKGQFNWTAFKAD